MIKFIKDQVQDGNRPLPGRDNTCCLIDVNDDAAIFEAMRPAEIETKIIIIFNFNFANCQ